MASEEMEISTDLGFHGLAEDIDIDLEFAAQPDEDLELGDFNQDEDFQHFNSDNRDEMMAENDDASYGMIDADDMSYNDSAAATNNFEIPIGDADVYSWQDADISGAQEDEIFADATGDDDGPEFETRVEMVGTTVDDSKLTAQAQDSTLDAVSPDATQNVESLVDGTEVVDNDEAAAAMDADADGIAEHDFEDSDEATTQDQAATESATALAAEDHATTLQSAPGTDSNDESAVKDSVDAEDNAAREPESEPQAADGDGNYDDDSQEVEDEISYEHEEADQDLHDEAVNPVTNLDHGSKDHSQEQSSPQAVVGEGVPAGDNDVYPADSDIQEVVVEPSSEDQEDQEPGDQEPEPAKPHNSSAQETANSPIQSELGGVDRAAAASEKGPQDMKQIASRHTMVVHYGETDYRLFANEADDDPSEYFFKDLSALELSLGEFLSEIRDVISEEVSPLDELVLHVDGLGLEFGETMASQILDTYTFGHVLSLYDKLVQNDATEETLDAPELYMYLMVKPNCLQRLMALQVQADSGRSLTDVAVYREASPEQETDRISGDTDDHVLSPDFTEELYDHDEQSGDDSFDHDHTEAEETQQEEPHEAELEEFGETEVPEQLEEDGPEETELPIGDDTDDVVDYDNLDLSPSQQSNAPFPSNSFMPPYCVGEDNCQCDTCWLQRVDDISTRSSPPYYEQSMPLARLDDIPGGSDGSQGVSDDDGHCQIERQLLQVISEANNVRYQDVRNETTNKSLPDSAEANLNTEADAIIESVLDTDLVVEERRAPPSESTSATATLDGNPNDEPNDEIDYDENDLDDGRGDAEAEGDDEVEAEAEEDADQPLPLSPAKLLAPLDEEITWESENEEARNEQSIISNPSEQVSTTPGKRARSGSDAAAVTDDRKDVKRQRS
ncbi:hypothetical protein KJ359_010281 [Pestalotiopsis sp. 9143b]|nr:hypothetical protein KJ359_010281 [Pestalotiopsis sp. 9143b]